MSRQLIETQLGLYFSVGPAGEESEALCANRQDQAYKVLDQMFREKALAMFGRQDPSFGPDVLFNPIELCECGWEGSGEDGKCVYSVWFYKTSIFTSEEGVKLRELARDAYEAVCDGDAGFVRAEQYLKWSESECRPFPL